MVFPPKLKKGDLIGITCPAGFMAAEKAQTCIHTLQDWGYEVLVGQTLGSESQTYFSGTDEERLDELQAMLDNKEIKAILFGRGGYGMGRIIDKLNFKKFKKNPKWVIGFSDITIFHCHVLNNYKIASLHAPMAAAFNDDGYKNEYVNSLAQVLKAKKSKYSFAPDANNQNGKATGTLVGGNLTLFTHTIGTRSEVNTDDCILFLEDIGEQIYGVDRMLIQLKRSGKLKNLAALIIGGFTDTKDTDRPFGKTVSEVFAEHTAEYDFPICYNFPVSHDAENYALIVGGKYQLSLSPDKCTLKEV